jgi:hypothetical protein
MQDKFNTIKEAYNQLHTDFLKENPILVKYIDSGVWAPSLPKELFKIFKKYEDKSKVFLDLGSGDGIAVMVASLFFKKAVGVELDKGFFNTSLKMKEKLKIANAEFINDDFHNLDFSDYDILFIAPDKEFPLKLENKISSELNGILIAYSSIFQPQTLKKVDEFPTHHFTVSVYRNRPKNV